MVLVKLIVGQLDYIRAVMLGSGLGVASHLKGPPIVPDPPGGLALRAIRRSFLAFVR